jgi:hypothetical protein
MDIGRSFTFMFDDDKWIEKIAIGGLLVLTAAIPLVNIFTGLVILGYMLRLLRNVSEGDPTPLPAWDDWGGDWMRGLMVVLALIVYAIPIILISFFVSLLGAIAGQTAALEGLANLCAVSLSCLSGLWSLAIIIVFPAAMIMYVDEGEFASFFNFRRIFRFIGDNLSNYIIALLLIIVANIIGGLGVILCVIGVFFTMFWAYLVMGHLLGQVKAQAMPTPLSPIVSEPPPPEI